MYILKNLSPDSDLLETNQTSGLISHSNHYLGQLGSFKRITNTKTSPWKWICSIHVHFPRQVYPSGMSKVGQVAKTDRFGSGLLISPRHVLTVAHNILGIDNSNRRVEPTIIKVIPGRNDKKNPSPFGTHRHRKYYFPNQFYQRATSSQGAEFDIAIIELRSSPGKKKRLGWWGRDAGSYLKQIDDSFRSQLKKRKVNVAGYPYAKDPEFTTRSLPAGLLYHDFDDVDSISSRMISYDVHTEKSMSGGPVWIKDKTSGHRYVVGVHQGRNLDTNQGRGVLLRPAIIDWLIKKVGSSLRVDKH